MKTLILTTVSIIVVLTNGQRQTTPIDRERQAYICANSVLDLIFVLDSSASIWEPDFYKQIKFVENIVKQFEIGPLYTQVGAVTFGQTYWHKFHLNRYKDKKSLLAAIKRIRYRAGSYTNTGDAIEYMNEKMFTPQHGDRFLSRNIAVVITDGRSQEKNKTREMAAAAHRAGIKMFAIGVGNRVSQKELQNIASDPDWEHVFEVDNYNALDSIKDTLTSRTCYELTTVGPPTQPPTTPNPVESWSEDRKVIIRTEKWNRTVTETKVTDEDDTFRILEEERRLRELEDERRRIREELEAEKQRLDLLEDERRRLRDLEAEQQRLRDLAEQQRLRDLEEQGRLRQLEEQRRIEEEQRRLAEEQQRLRDLEAEQQRLRDLEAEKQRLRDLEAEKQRLRDLEAERQRLRDDLENERRRLQEQEERRRQLENEQDNQRNLDADRLRRQQEAERLRREQEAERLRREQEAERLRRQQEADRLRKQREDELKRRQLEFGNANREGPSGFGIFGRRPVQPVRNSPDMTFLISDEMANGIDVDKLMGRCNDKPADIYFVMDSSSSIGRKNYKKQKRFLVNLAKQFDIGPDKTRIGAITFSNSYNVAIPLGSANDINSLSKKLHNIPYKRGGTHTAAALKYVKNFGFSSDFARPGAAQIVIVLTDGYSRDPAATRQEARKLHDAGINTFVIGIGNGIDMNELRDIASNPDATHLFQVDDYNALDTIRDMLVSRACDSPINSLVVCKTFGPMDIVFMYDSLNLGRQRTDQITNFMFDVVETLHQQSFNNVRVRRLIDNCPVDGQTSLMTPPDFLRLRGGNPNPGMYEIITQYITDIKNNRQDYTTPIGVAFIDSELENMDTILPYIESLSNKNLFSVVIGPEPRYNTSGMRNLMLIPSYEALDEMVRTFLQHFCTTLTSDSIQKTRFF